jgi:hypothetical protein
MMIETLQRGWDKKLNGLFQNVENELVVSSPYISDIGAKFIIDNVSDSFKSNGIIKFVTDLSPKNIYQGSTDPKSFRQLFKAIRSVEVFHLPRLHAKVYIGDTTRAIITSANLTAGGIYSELPRSRAAGHLISKPITRQDQRLILTSPGCPFHPSSRAAGYFRTIL